MFGLNGEIGHAAITAVGLAAISDRVQEDRCGSKLVPQMGSRMNCPRYLGATFKQYLLNNLKLYGNARYRSRQRDFQRGPGGVKYFPLVQPDLYRRVLSRVIPSSTPPPSIPCLPLTSTGRRCFRVDYTFNDIVSVNAGYNRQGYGEGAVANVYHAGVGLRPSNRSE